MRHLLLLALVGAAFVGCANDHPATTPASDSMLTIAPAPVGTVTEVPLSQPAANRVP